MSTAKQLIPAFVDAPPATWSREYVQNMREIRGYPNWWRIRDDVAYIDGPPNEGEQYTRDLYVWSVEIVKDEDTGANTNKLELYDLNNTLEESTSVVNGETVYRYKYREQEPELSYEHTDVIDSVSLEFDQLGRRLIAFESAGDVFLIWYDPVPGNIVVTNWGAGYTPQIVTDTYRRTGGSADSERLLFYVDNTTKQIVYRRQLDRYLVKYQVPDAPSDVVEILKVDKNLYGGITVVYCYENSGILELASFTARADVGVAHIGSDGSPLDSATLSAKSGQIVDFFIAEGLVKGVAQEQATLSVSSGSITSFELKDNIYRLNNQTSEASLTATSGTITNFEHKESVRRLTEQNNNASLSVSSGSIERFILEEALIETGSFGADTADLTVTSGTIVDFFLG